MKQTITSIKEKFDAIAQVKAALAKDLRAIADDDTRSGNYKNAQRMAAKDKARQELQKIVDDTDILLKALDEKAKALYGQFDYSNPKLAGAVSFIKSSGKNLPEAAVKQIISDFRGHPGELKYLATLFNENGVIDASMDATEAANAASMKYALPERLSDSLYYSVRCEEPEKDIDFSGYVSELDTYAEALPEAEPGK